MNKNKTIFTKRGAAILFAALATTALTGINARADEPTEQASVVTKYETPYFTKFSPQTLYDMIEKIPGTTSILNSINNNNNDRGFGSAGDQILIDGKRIAGKSNGINAELNRIQAKNVERIELIRGTIEGLDVQSEGLIINVILKDDVASSTLWEVRLKRTAGIKAEILGSFTHSGTAGDLKYSFGAERFANPRRSTYTEIFTTKDHALDENLVETEDALFSNLEFSGKIEYEVSDKTDFRFNGLIGFGKLKGPNPKVIDYANPAAGEPSQIIEAVRRDNKDTNWEIGGDFTHKFDTLGTFKLLFISNYIHFEGQRWEDLIEDNAPAYNNFSTTRDMIAKENIIRGSLNKKLSAKHSLEAGLELAINSRDDNFNFHKAGTDPLTSNPYNNTKETRYEAFVTHNFAISSALNLQSSLNSEWSKIEIDSLFTFTDNTGTTTTPFYNSRSFNYLKPRFNLRYDLTEKDQFRLTIERTVSQLQLWNFAPRFNSILKKLETTNPDLRPEKRWKFSATYERQLGEDAGNISATLYYHAIKDHLTEIPLNNWSANGNLDTAKEYGIKLDGSLRLTALGLENTVISGDILYRDSDTINPFTGKAQYINNLVQVVWNASLKHDETDLGLAFGFDLYNQSAERYHRYDYTARYENNVNASAYIEYKIANDLKLKLFANNLIAGEGLRTTTRHTGLHTNTEIRRFEDRRTKRDTQITLTLKGQF